MPRLDEETYSTVNLQETVVQIIILPQLGVHFMHIQAITHLLKGSRY